MNLKILRIMIKVSEIEISELAKRLNISQETLEDKLNSKVEFYAHEICEISYILSISDPNIFYLA